MNEILYGNTGKRNNDNNLMNKKGFGIKQTEFVPYHSAAVAVNKCVSVISRVFCCSDWY